MRKYVTLSGVIGTLLAKEGVSAVVTVGFPNFINLSGETDINNFCNMLTNGGEVKQENLTIKCTIHEKGTFLFSENNNRQKTQLEIPKDSVQQVVEELQSLTTDERREQEKQWTERKYELPKTWKTN